MAEEKYFLGRQPVLTRQQVIYGYELLFRAADISFANVTDHSFACASVVISALSNFGFTEVLGRHQGFINVDREFLMSDELELLPRDKVILELLEVIELNAAVVERCKELKHKGFKLALDDHIYSPEYENLYRFIDVIKIDLLQYSELSLYEVVQQFKPFPVKLLAEKVETIEQFNECRELGFDLYQGYFFSKPVVLKKKRVDISSSSLVKIQQLLLQDAEIDQIESTFRQNPNLIFNLLKLVNSVAMGLRDKIRTLRHAITILGRRQLLRWTYLALFAADDVRPGNATLLELAATRARLMELIVKNHRSSKGDDYHELAFIVGILSLIDLLFEVSMEDVVSSLNLTEEVRIALVGRQGELGELLTLVEGLERTDFKSVKELLSKTAIDEKLLFCAQLEAINWTNELIST